MIDKVKDSCTGCKMCGDVCPKNAISFSVNDEGFWYPFIDEKKCIKCNVCEQHCPKLNVIQNEICTHKVYASWNRDEETRRESTSGGICGIFAKYVIKNGGYVVGCVYTDDYKGAFHTYVNDEEGLKKILGSKYFQSDTEGIYRKTKGLLNTGKIVLFVGSPCQVVALKSYLGKEYLNLFTIDFLCHGMPSPKLHKNKIELYERKYRKKVTFYRDKYDKYSWTDFGELVKFENGKEKFISRWIDNINNCFIHENLNLRKSCYSCDIKNGKNSSDLTVGDFWEIKGITEKDKKLGVSALIVNSKMGAEILNNIGEYIYLENRTIEELKRGNPAYSESAMLPENRDTFFEQVEKEGLEKTVKKFTNNGICKKIKSYYRVFKSQNRKWIPIIKNIKRVDIIKFIKYNYFCKNIHRDSDCFVIPCKGSLLQLAKHSNIVLHGNLLLNYYPSYKRGNANALICVENNGTLLVNNRVEIAHANTISVGNNAILKLGHFYTGVGANVICHYDIEIGNNVMIGRDVCIFDSDYHPIYNDTGAKINSDKKVKIEDNVWIGARSMVLKGAVVHRGAIISANSMVMGNVEENRVFVNKRESKSIGENIIWER